MRPPYWLVPSAAIPRQKLEARTPDAFCADGIKVRTRHRVAEIDTKQAVVTVRDREAGRTYTEPFDKLQSTSENPPAIDFS